MKGINLFNIWKALDSINRKNKQPNKKKCKDITSIHVPVVVQLFGHVQLFATPWTAARQASLSITTSQSLLKLMSIELVMSSNHLILFSCLQSFPASGLFQ